MATIEITQVTLNEKVTKAIIGDLDPKIKTILGDSPYVLSTGVQEPNLLQIISGTSTSGSSLLKLLETIPLGSNLRSFRVALEHTPFMSGQFIDAPVVEHVQTYFPASRVTSEFKAKIEEDFARFYAPLNKAPGSHGLVQGWTIDELSHEDVKHEKTVCFVIVRGWDRMEDFNKSIDSEIFRTNIGVILAWKSPGDLWHVENKKRSGITSRNDSTAAGQSIRWPAEL